MVVDHGRWWPKVVFIGGRWLAVAGGGSWPHEVIAESDCLWLEMGVGWPYKVVLNKRWWPKKVVGEGDHRRW